MKIALISNPVNLPREHDLVNALLEKGLNYFHLRKPEMGKPELENFLKGINPSFYKKIRIHSHFSLIEKYNLGGIHLTEKMRKEQGIAETIKAAGRRGIQVSASFHSVNELNDCRQFEYVFLSPVFDSISKKGYLSSISLNDFVKARKSGNIKTKVMALGGIDQNNIDTVLKADFDGIALLGSIWKNFERDNDLQKNVQHFFEIKAKTQQLSKV